ncbi:hypothetical protein EZS27_024703, partial [termite gut metagenome]
KEKANGDYKTPETLRRLENDFKNKCYICESKAPHTINVEHFNPHQGNQDLKFDWNNLFWACGHCNNTKLATHNNLLNCTDIDDNVEEAIHYYINPFPKEKVKLEVLSPSVKADNTKDLLLAVYNGTTALKTLESSNIRTSLLKDIKSFQSLLFDYYDTYEGVEEEKAKCKSQIIAHLNSSSSFTAFKRWIIRDNPERMRDFGEYL